MSDFIDRDPKDIEYHVFRHERNYGNGGLWTPVTETLDAIIETRDDLSSYPGLTARLLRWGQYEDEDTPGYIAYTEMHGAQVRVGSPTDIVIEGFVHDSDDWDDPGYEHFHVEKWILYPTNEVRPQYRIGGVEVWGDEEDDDDD